MRFRVIASACLVVLLGGGWALAQTTDLSNGVFIAHAPAGLQYTTDPPSGGWCGAYTAIDSCSEQVNRVDTEGAVVWYVLSAWTESKQWCGAQFGFGDYDAENFVIEDHGPCFPGSGMTIPTSGWPGPNEGIALTTTDDNWSGNFVPIYWFAGYVYGEDVIPLGPDPDSDLAGWARCEDQQETAAAALGGLGLLTDGIYACPEGAFDSGSDSSLVWQLEVVDSIATVTRNELTNPLYRQSFPREVVAVRRVTSTWIQQGDHVSPNIKIRVYPLEVDPHGLFAGTSTLVLPDSGANKVTCVGPTRRGLVLRSPAGSESGKTLGQRSSISYRSLDVDLASVDDWEAAPTGQLIVVHTGDSTLFFDPERDQPIGTYLRRTTDVAFSQDGRAVAAIARSPADQSALVLFDERANVVYEGPMETTDMSQLYLVPSATAAVLGITERDGTHYWVAFDMQTHQSMVLEGVPDGIRYHSADGNTMLVVQPGYGRAHLYDSSDPFSPQLLGSYEAGSLVYAGAVSDDGSSIALQVVEESDARLCRVVVLNRDMQAMATLLTETEAKGLTFDGQLLFVGLQDHPLPLTTALVTTTGIYLFDLGQ